jgi:hypothetical protein
MKPSTTIRGLVVATTTAVVLFAGSIAPLGAATHAKPKAVPLSKVPASVKKWYTVWDKTSSYPDATDPTWKLPIKYQAQFACIRYHESRNHLIDGVGSQGWYQFTVPTWQYARSYIKGLPSTPNRANGDQQSAVAVFYFKRNGRVSVEWSVDYVCYS